VASEPILVISSASNPFSEYYAEILRTEGFNEFTLQDISSITSTVLSTYDIVILAEMPLTSAQVTMLSNWVNSGGNLIAMKPDKKLAGLLGLTDLSSTISNAYLLVNTSSGPGTGIVNQTIQYHGAADRYNLNGASSIATLYSNATTSIFNPAVTLRSVGTNGGQAAAFTYDLARSVVLTRQGNPAWSGQERDGYFPIRSNDLFYGDASFDPRPDWVDMNKVSIPQADEQQRLLANLMIRMNFSKKPLPRFWYFPRSLPAVVIMTGDDHGWGVAGTAGRFDQFESMSPEGCSLDKWECIRSTSYVVPSPAIILNDAEASAYNAAGFEIAVHINTGDQSSSDPNVGCANFTPSSFEHTVSTQLGDFRDAFPSLPNPLTNRNHCVTWSDYSTVPSVEENHGIHLDTNYYYWPPSWVADTPGFFTGSGMPMRFTDASGNLMDVYQATTQMTDESGQAYPYTIDTLLDRALGPEGFYGVFTANMHTDTFQSAESDAIVNSAITRGIPVISARQLLMWVDGRNSSTINSITWNGTALGFTVSAALGATELTSMVPVPDNRIVSSITNNGSSIPFSLVEVKGLQYARFTTTSGMYQVNFEGAAPP